MTADEWSETIKTGTWDDKELTNALASRDAHIDTLIKLLNDEMYAHAITAGKLLNVDADKAVNDVNCKDVLNDSRLSMESIPSARIR